MKAFLDLTELLSSKLRGPHEIGQPGLGFAGDPRESPAVGGCGASEPFTTPLAHVPVPQLAPPSSPRLGNGKETAIQM